MVGKRRASRRGKGRDWASEQFIDEFFMYNDRMKFLTPFEPLGLHRIVSMALFWVFLGFCGHEHIYG